MNRPNSRSPVVVHCVLTSLCAHAWAASLPLPFGQTQTGTISSPAQSNAYSLNSNAGDAFDFTIVSTAGTLSPQLQLYDSSGKLVASATTPYYCGNGSAVELNSVQLATAGAYTLLVSDCSNTNTGNYTLYAQKVSNPAGAAALPFGQTQTATISSAAASTSYVITVSANDVADFTIVPVSGNISPKIRVYSASGTQIGSATTPYYCGDGPSVELNTLQFPAAGSYTVLVGDCGDTNVGGFVIYAQKTDGATGATPLAFGGQPQPGTINSPALSSTWAFAGSAGDVLNFTAVQISGSVSPKLRLYNPAGAQIGSATTPYYCGDGSSVEMNGIKLPVSGNYTLLVGDCSDNNTGTYNLSVECFGVCAASAPTPAQSFILTLQVSPMSSAGTIAASPASPSGVYAAGTQVCLTATASSGWVFQSWAGATLDSSSCLVMNSNQTVTAIFVSATTTSPPTPSTPSIQVTSIPQFGASPGSVSGIVAGVAPAGYQVAPLVFLSGEGWYTKPYCNSTTVPLAQDGSFTALLTTGGADPYATEIALLVVPASASVPCYSSVAGIPSDLLQQAVAQITINRPNPNEREIQFAGQSWAVKASPPNGSGGSTPIGPGGCVFSDSSGNVTVDSQGNLHLKITNTAGTWSCAEIYSRAAVSYGRATWTITGTPMLDPTSVFGAFTWMDAASTPRELDVEFGFSNPGDTTNSQFVVQPASQSGNLQRISLPASGPITFAMTWLPDSLVFQAFSGTDDTGPELAHWAYAGSVPPADQPYINWRFNLWLNGGPPASGQNQEAVISNFQYQPFVADPAAPSLDSLLNAASFVPGSSLGALFLASGQNLATQSQSASSVPLPTSQDGVAVSINGIPAPLVSVSPNQILGQVPYIAPVGPSQAAVTVNGNSSQVLAFPNIAASPGVFPNAQNCLAQNPDGSLNSSTDPAMAGSTVTAYLTGIGPLDNPVASGAAAPASPLSHPLLAATAQLDGQPATLNFIGLVPGLVGVAQANLQVPSSAATGQRSLVITIGGAASNACPISVSNPNAAAPVISSLSPSSATAGGVAFTVTVTGSGFVNGSTVEWNSSPLTTTYISSSQLQAAVPAALLATPGTPGVTVVNPGNVLSNAVAFSITAAAPVISSVSPSSATAGGPAFTLAVTGTALVNGSTVEWNGSPLTTSYISSTQLQAAVPASLIASAGTASITVVNPGGVVSNAIAYTVSQPAPNPAISATTQACAVKGTVTGATPASAFRVVVYALTNYFYIQPCYPGQVLNAIDPSGNFGPIASHSGSIYLLLVSPNYNPPATTGALPAVDHVNVFAVVGPVGTLSNCDVTACPAQ